MDNEKKQEILKYLENTWAPIDLVTEKFQVTRWELSKIFAEMLSEVDVRVENDIVHVG